VETVSEPASARFVHRTSIAREGAMRRVSSLSMSHVARATAAHKPLKECRCPWSERFVRIFRNEEVEGSNPPSSTISPCGV
jgi:hypothetical protein